jgi:hypothetical protein
VPKQKLHIVDGNILISKTSSKAPLTENGTIFFGADITNDFPSGSWGIEYVSSDDPDYGGYGLNFWRPWSPGGGTYFNYGLFLHNEGNVGIGKRDPQRKLDVNGDVSAKGNIVLNEGQTSCLSFGGATNQNLNWGTSYIGFNAHRNTTTENWTCAGDGAHNGGGVIYATVTGDIYFASVPSTGTGAKTLTDTQIKQNIKLHLTHDGVLKTKQVSVTLANWPDFVFENDYNLLPLNEVAQYIKHNNRLPAMPSAKEIEENGLDLGEMQSKLLQKVEELTLYILDLQQQIDELKQTKGAKQ